MTTSTQSEIRRCMRFEQLYNPPRCRHCSKPVVRVYRFGFQRYAHEVGGSRYVFCASLDCTAGKSTARPRPKRWFRLKPSDDQWASVRIAGPECLLHPVTHRSCDMYSDCRRAFWRAQDLARWARRDREYEWFKEWVSDPRTSIEEALAFHAAWAKSARLA